MRAWFDYIVYARRNTPKIAPTAPKQMGYSILITFYIDEGSGGAALLTSASALNKEERTQTQSNSGDAV